MQTIKTINAIAGKTAREILAKGGRGRVLGVYSDGAYILFGNRLLMLCACNYGEIPFGISIFDCADVMPMLDLRTDASVSVDGEILSLESGEVRLKLRHPFFINGFDVFVMPNNIIRSAERVAKAGDGDGFAPLIERNGTLTAAVPEGGGKYASAALPRLTALVDALKRGDKSGIDACIPAVVGLGKGLTPSGDDFLVGLLAALSFFGKKQPFGLLASAVKGCADSHTSLISSAYLHAAADNLRFSLVDDYLSTLGDINFSLNALDALLSVGNNSGSDMAAGAITGAVI